MEVCLQCSNLAQVYSADNVIILDPLPSLDAQCKLVFDNCDQQRLNARRELKKLRSMRIKSDPNLVESECEPTKPPQAKQRGPHLPSINDDYITQLTDLIRILPHDYESCGYTHVDRAIIHIFFARGEYAQVQSSITKIAPTLPLVYHDEIEDLWAAASYQLYMLEFNKSSLNSVQRLRVRVRNPCPTIRLHGPKRYKMTESMRKTLELSFQGNPKPNKEAKNQLAESTGLKKTTISNWFKNRRARMRSEMRSSFSIDSTSTASSSYSPSSEHSTGISSYSPSYSSPVQNSYHEKPLMYPSTSEQSTGTSSCSPIQNGYDKKPLTYQSSLIHSMGTSNSTLQNGYDEKSLMYPSSLETPKLDFEHEFGDFALCTDFAICTDFALCADYF